MILLVTGIITAGKTTLMNRMQELGYNLVIEYTTRPMRKGEINHKDYHYISDEEFREMEHNKEFAETLIVNTIYGLWCYGAKKEDLKDDYVLFCGMRQAMQVIENDVPCLFVLLDIDKDSARERAKLRGDNMQEFERRFTSDSKDVEIVRKHADIILDSKNSVETNIQLIENRYSLKRMDIMKGNGDTHGKV